MSGPNKSGRGCLDTRAWKLSNLGKEGSKVRLGYGLNLEQSQKLIMTPELRQAIALLQLNALELAAYVDQQMLENPLLEVQEEEAESKEPAEDGALRELNEEADLPVSDSELDWQEYFQDTDKGKIRAERLTSESKASWEQMLTAAPTLHEYLLEQLHWQKRDCSLALAEYIIGNLDDDGYLNLALAEIAADQGVSASDVEQALAVVQSLDPAGIAARNLQECLSLQSALWLDCPPEMPEFLNHLEDLACGRLQRIAQELKIPVARVQELADLVRTLDPKPGLRFPGNDELRYILPDVVVEEVSGEYVILVNDTSVPRLHINQTYRQALSKDGDAQTREFVEHKLNAAAWLIRSIEQRRLTLYKVARAIVDHQEAFLRAGIRHLKPLTLRDIAEDVGVHESTVSRATSNKYIQTPRGTFEFKFFFATGIGTERPVSTEVVKQALRELILAEDEKHPLSDQKLAELLMARGMEISRRTVAKYRDELGIPAAAVRRRY